MRTADENFAVDVVGVIGVRCQRYFARAGFAAAVGIVVVAVVVVQN